MAYPLPPDFLSGEPFAAWWGYAVAPAVTHYCATSGTTVLRAARRAAGLGDSNVWDATFRQALVARAEELARDNPGTAWGAVRDALRADLPSPEVGALAVQFALWLGLYRPHGLRFDAIVVPPNARLPMQGMALVGATTDTPMVCWDPAQDADPSLLGAAAQAQAAAESRTGVRVRPGEPTPQAPVPPPSVGGVPPWALWLTGAAFGGLLWYSMRRPGQGDRD